MRRCPAHSRRRSLELRREFFPAGFGRLAGSAAAALFLLVAGAEGIASSCAAARPALARALVRHRVAAPAVAVSTRPRRQTPAARQLLVQLEGLRGTRAAPVDAAKLASLVRPLAPTLRGPLLLDVLIGLRERGLWQVALALAQLLEVDLPARGALKRHDEVVWPRLCQLLHHGARAQ